MLHHIRAQVSVLPAVAWTTRSQLRRLIRSLQRIGLVIVQPKSMPAADHLTVASEPIPVPRARQGQQQTQALVENARTGAYRASALARYAP